MNNLKEIIEENFRQYAGAVLQSRALVDVRDCLKPSARQIFYCLYTDKFTADKPFKKTLKAIGSASRMYIHGDSSAVGIIMRAGQPFAYRYPLIDVEGSYGNLMESGNWASQRYTSSKLSKISTHLFDSINKNTIEEWIDNYDETEKYPMVLPSKGFYNIVNGTMGIGVGAAASIPTFNLNEVNAALIKLLWNPTISFEEIYCPPDFPTGGVLLNEEEVKSSLKDGFGKACKIRSVVEYDTKDKALVVKEIPYGVYTNTICKNQLEEILASEENPGIDRFNDLTGENPLIKIYLSRGANPDKVLKYLFKNTSLQTHYGINLTMLENGRYPKIFTWKQALQSYLTHQIEVYTRGFEFDLKEIKDRLHIIEGILIALARIEEVIQVIKGSSTTTIAKENLIKTFLLSEVQAKAILDIRLARLANLEVKKFEKERDDLLVEKNRIEAILKDENLLKKEIEKDLREVAKKFGDPRKTKILNLSAGDEEITEIKSLLISLTNQNNIFVSEVSSLYTQRRGGVGNKFKLNSGEFIVSTMTARTDQTALFFSEDGIVYQTKLAEFSLEEKISLDLLLGLNSNTKICNIVSLDPKNTKKHIIFLTKKGFLKKSLLKEYNTKRSGGIKAITLEENDLIKSILFIDDEQIGILSQKGSFIRINTDDIKTIGRVARGVKGMDLRDNDEVVAAMPLNNTIKEIVSISSKGLIKRTDLSEISTTGRATKGAKLHSIKEDDAMAAVYPVENEKTIIIVSNKVKLRINLDEILLSRRGTNGVVSIKLSTGEFVVGLSKI